MYKVIIGAFLALFSLTVQAQGEANIWYFGYKAGLDFNTGVPVAITNGQINTSEGCATISNTAGQLQFYTDGITVWDKNHNVMPNGNGLMGHTSTTQSALAVPQVGSSTKYFLFTVDYEAKAAGFRYSVVDMSLNGGLGDVTSEKNIPILTPTCEKLTVVKNTANDGYWVLVHGYGDNAYYAYSITASGLNLTPVVSSIGYVVPVHPRGYTSSGYLKFSPDGNKILAAHGEAGVVELLDFDNATGMVSNNRTVCTRAKAYGVEFSKSGNVGYVTISSNVFTAATPQLLLQFDLTSANIPSTEVVLFSNPGDGSRLSTMGSLQMGPDGKIYNTNQLSGKLNAITNPEVLGAGCGLVMDAIDLGSTPGDFHYTKLGLPQFIQSFFQTDITSKDYCSGFATSFSLTNAVGVTNAVWDFGDGSPSQSGTSVSHIYAFPGNYTVTVTVTSASGTTSKTKQIVIASSPTANPVSDQLICGQAAMLYNLGQHNGAILGMQSGSVFGVKYFRSAADAVNGSNELPANYALSPGTVTVFAKVYNLVNPACYAVANFKISLYQQPIVVQPSDYVICESVPYNNIEVFNLQSKNSEILNGQDPAVFNVSYHPTSNDAINNINPLPNSYTNTNPTETIHVRVANVNESSCFATTTLVLKVIQSPTITAVSDYKICDDVSNNGTETFDLTTKTPEVLNGQPAATFQVTYHLNQADSQNGVNPIASPIVNTSQNQVIYFRISVVGNSGCYAVGSFRLSVNKLPVANSVPDQFLCDSGNDGSELFNLDANNSIVLGNQNIADFSVTYHLTQSDADNKLNALPASYQNISNPQILYTRIENKLNGTCHATGSFKIGLYKTPVAHAVSDQFACSVGTTAVFQLNGRESILLGNQSAADFNISYHLSQADANAGINMLSASYTNTSNPQTIFIRMENKLAKTCFVTSSFQIVARQKPVLAMTEEYTICEGSSVAITAPSGYDGYLWSNGDTGSSTVITNAGNYSLTVTKNYGDIVCDQTQNFVVHNSNVAVINEIKISDWSSNENAIEIMVTGDGDYEYSIDGVVYQQSNVFSNLPNWTYTVYVKDKRGCGVTTEEVQLLMYPRFFTPNGDGYNDTWSINSTDKEPDLSFSIFDRFGKLLKVIKNNGGGWDGTFNGELLPATDYWFVVKRQDGREYKGHFALKR